MYFKHAVLSCFNFVHLKHHINQKCLATPQRLLNSTDQHHIKPVPLAMAPATRANPRPTIRITRSRTRSSNRITRPQRPVPKIHLKRVDGHWTQVGRPPVQAADQVAAKQLDKVNEKDTDPDRPECHVCYEGFSTNKPSSRYEYSCPNESCVARICVECIMKHMDSNKDKNEVHCPFCRCDLDAVQESTTNSRVTPMVVNTPVHRWPGSRRGAGDQS